MAGGGHGPFRHYDASIERFDRWRESAYLRFRWTPSHFRTFAAYFIIFPGALYMAHSYANERYNWRGARRGIPLDKHTAAAQAAEE
ncbi:hypothetical protein CYLTODRAFT_490416 [Cylindrobasidium torrendii FP15055 ss-10]|uniref:Complex I-B15 n=1 Tax=Cylindrobasidium torrendii FP15055 ss-10 TaxID=1314674 RepID=A0A0D7BDT2_9AGAR|nr:hypothetical protein CYLTODRAFT_490416 [Cylindrobasidium torrendii FP15055 ss-10]